MKLPIINFSLGTQLDQDFDAFMERMRTGVACFYYFKVPKKGKKNSGALRKAFGTMSPELCPPVGGEGRTAWMKKYGLHHYWELVRDTDGNSRKFFDNGWRGFYECRWIGWYPEIVVECDEEGVLEIPDDVFEKVEPLLQ